MPDTPRSLADLQALLSTNLTGQISSQDLRDFLVSSLGVYGLILCFEAGHAQDNPDTGVKLTCFAGNGSSHGVTPDYTDDSLTIDVEGIYDINFQCSFSGTGNSVVKFRLRVDAVETQIGCTRKLGSGGDIGSCSFIGQGFLPLGSVLTVYIESDGATDDFVIEDCQLSVNMVG